MPEQTTTTMILTQGDLPDAAARGKMAMGPSTVEPNQEQGRTSIDQAAESNDDDVVEDIQGHPQDGWQHVYIYHKRGHHYVCHEEISIDEETERVERAARRLIREVQVSTTSRNHCYRAIQICSLTYMVLYLVCMAL
jgi:hypothetical protein